MVGRRPLFQLKACNGYVLEGFNWPAYTSIWCIKTFYGFRPYGVSLCKSGVSDHDKVTKTLPPPRTALAPVPLRGHAATGHPWPDRSSPGIHAGRPTPRNLLSASRRGGRSRSRSRSKAKSKARSKTKSKARSKARSKTRSQTELSRVYPYGRSPVCSLALKSVLPSHPPPKAAINCTLAINRLCNRFNTVRSLDKAVVCTVTTSK